MKDKLGFLRVTFYEFASHKNEANRLALEEARQDAEAEYGVERVNETIREAERILENQLKVSPHLPYGTV